MLDNHSGILVKSLRISSYVCSPVMPGYRNLNPGNLTNSKTGEDERVTNQLAKQSMPTTEDVYAKKVSRCVWIVFIPSSIVILFGWNDCLVLTLFKKYCHRFIFAIILVSSNQSVIVNWKPVINRYSWKLLLSSEFLESISLLHSWQMQGLIVTLKYNYYE